MSDRTLFTVVTGLGEKQLVNDNVVSVDFVGSEFLDKSLGFVEGEELGDADTNKSCLFLFNDGG